MYKRCGLQKTPTITNFIAKALFSNLKTTSKQAHTNKYKKHQFLLDLTFGILNAG